MNVLNKKQRSQILMIIIRVCSKILVYEIKKLYHFSNISVSKRQNMSGRPAHDPPKYVNFVTNRGSSVFPRKVLWWLMKHKISDFKLKLVCIN